MSDLFDGDEMAWMRAASDQMQAALEHRKAALFEEYLAGGEPTIEPVRCWQEGGIWCAVVVGPIGALCGYARLPDRHPWIGLHYDDQIPDPPELDLEQPTEQAMDDHGAIPIFAAMCSEDGVDEYQRTMAAAVPVHGGLTYTGPMPIKGAPHGWWLGFDCGHAGDAPAPERWLGTRPWTDEAHYERLFADGHVWTEDDVALEVKRMVAIIVARKRPETPKLAKDRQDGCPETPRIAKDRQDG